MTQKRVALEMRQESDLRDQATRIWRWLGKNASVNAAVDLVL